MPYKYRKSISAKVKIEDYDRIVEKAHSQGLSVNAVLGQLAKEWLEGKIDIDKPKNIG